MLADLHKNPFIRIALEAHCTMYTIGLVPKWRVDRTIRLRRFARMVQVGGLTVMEIIWGSQAWSPHHLNMI